MGTAGCQPRLLRAELVVVGPRVAAQARLVQRVPEHLHARRQARKLRGLVGQEGDVAARVAAPQGGHEAEVGPRELVRVVTLHKARTPRLQVPPLPEQGRNSFHSTQKGATARSKAKGSSLQSRATQQESRNWDCCTAAPAWQAGCTPSELP